MRSTCLIKIKQMSGKGRKKLNYYYHYQQEPCEFQLHVTVVCVSTCVITYEFELLILGKHSPYLRA